MPDAFVVTPASAEPLPKLLVTARPGSYVLVRVSFRRLISAAGRARSAIRGRSDGILGPRPRDCGHAQRTHCRV
jgi:hypothetical protein